jgi:APA family basic amino acid/polyamine antiporter
MSSSDTGFRKSLTLFDSTALVAGSMIGSGIFIVSADMARNLGSPGWLLIAWLITGIITVIAALSYGELAAMMPRAGGQYVYISEAFNPFSGFLYGWTLFMVIQTGTIAAVAMAFSKYMGVLIPWFSEKNVLADLGTLQIGNASLLNVRITTVHILAILMIILLTYNNVLGIRNAKWVQNFFTATKVILLIGFIIIGLVLARNNPAMDSNRVIFWEPLSSAGNLLSGWALVVAIGISLVGSLFSADAWNNITFAASEVKNPQKNIPYSLVLGVSTVIILYLLANMAYLNTLPLRGNPEGISVLERGMQFATNDRLGSAAIDGLFGAAAASIMAAFVVISTFGCNNGLILSGARVYYAMAKDNLFFRSASRLNAKGVPANGLIFQAVWASLLCLSGTYSDLLDYVVIAVLLFYVLTILGVYVLRIRKPDAERPYKAFGYPVLPAVYILVASLLIFILLKYKPTHTWPGIYIVLAGIPVYLIWKWRLKK